jgi:hypothetical protein
MRRFFGFSTSRLNVFLRVLVTTSSFSRSVAFFDAPTASPATDARCFAAACTLSRRCSPWPVPQTRSPASP